MTTPARIAAFLSTSALCLGLASVPAQAADSRATQDVSRTTPDLVSQAKSPTAHSGTLAVKATQKR